MSYQQIDMDFQMNTNIDIILICVVYVLRIPFLQILIAKLEAGKASIPPEKKAEIMKSIKMLTENIEKTKKELSAKPTQTRDKKQVSSRDATFQEIS